METSNIFIFLMTAEREKRRRNRQMDKQSIRTVT